MKLHKLIPGLVMALCLTACASETTTHDATQLPQKARDLIAQNFNSAISLVEIEKSMGSVSEYEVTLTDGCEISFKGDGEWKSIETPPTMAVPEGLVPTNIAKYVAEKHAGAFIDGIEKNKHGFEIELSNNIEIQFDSAGNFLKYDK